MGSDTTLSNLVRELTLRFLEKGLRIQKIEGQFSKLEFNQATTIAIDVKGNTTTKATRKTHSSMTLKAKGVRQYLEIS